LYWDTAAAGPQPAGAAAANPKHERQQYQVKVAEFVELYVGVVRRRRATWSRSAGRSRQPSSLSTKSPRSATLVKR
jgi:hypothetical protein